MTLTSVAEAFAGANPDAPEYYWRAAAILRGEILVIDGLIYCNSTIVGRFERRLQFAHGQAEAIHVIMEVEAPHRERKLAYHHYRNALRFYDSLGITKVRLDADGHGPVIWPQLGADVALPLHRSMLHSILRSWGYEPLVTAEEIFVPDIALSERRGMLIGQEALRELFKRLDAPIPMVIDLADKRHRKFLLARGILREVQ